MWWKITYLIYHSALATFVSLRFVDGQALGSLPSGKAPGQSHCITDLARSMMTIAHEANSMGKMPCLHNWGHNKKRCWVIFSVVCTVYGVWVLGGPTFPYSMLSRFHPLLVSMESIDSTPSCLSKEMDPLSHRTGFGPFFFLIHFYLSLLSFEDGKVVPTDYLLV